MIDSVPEYLERAETLIYGKTKEHATVDYVKPRWHPCSGADWELVTFKATIRFAGNQILEITDHFSRDSDGGFIRKFAYWFGEPGDEEDEVKTIFKIDNHGLFGGEEHLHSEDDECLVEGDARLNGFSPAKVEVTDVFKFVDLYLNKKPFPWVEP